MPDSDFNLPPDAEARLEMLDSEDQKSQPSDLSTGGN